MDNTTWDSSAHLGLVGSLWQGQYSASKITAALLTIFVVSNLVLPMAQSKYTKNNVLRIGKSRLMAWLSWDMAPWLALEKYISKGYKQAIKGMGKPFAVTMCGMETNVLPEKYLPSLRGEDRENLSLCQGFENMFNMTATTGKDGRHDHVEIDVVAKYINPRLSAFFARQVALADYAFDVNFGDAKDWKKFNTFELGASLIYHVTATVLVGDELARNENYIKSVLDYSKSFLMSGFVWPIRPWGPQWLREWTYWMCTWALRRDINRAFKFLLPVINERFDLVANNAQDRPIDMIQGLVESEVPSPEEGTPIRHAHRILHITFAASAVSSAMILHTLHQTLMTPQYIEPLREEINVAVAKHGWTERALANMPFLESYIRELLRLYPPSILTGQRTIINGGHKFDNDFFLPEGSRIAFPAMFIHTDEDHYPEPMRFNPYRFMGEKAIDNPAATRIDSKYLSFGFGKQACPGRWMAVRQVKLILAKMIDGYDFKWAGKVPKEITRTIVEGQIFPDITTQISFKKRVKA